MRLTKEAHALIRKHVGPGDIAIDATMGNGHDTLFLADLVGPAGQVYSFDIQEEAVVATSGRIVASGLANVILITSCHSKLADHLPEGIIPTVAGAVFNLGYLPGADKSIVTRTDTTVAAIEAAYETLRPGGVISVLAYTGHAGGEAEAHAVEATLNALPARTWLRRDPAVPDSNSPRLLVIRR